MINFVGWHAKWMDHKIQHYLKFKRDWQPVIRHMMNQIIDNQKLSNP